MWGRDTNLAIAEYWRWWVVHLWVVGLFEVFTVAVAALALARMGLVRVRSATMAVLFTTILYLAGGVLGTFHHLYFAGTTPAIIALGGTFSALELVPLVMIGYEGYDNWSLKHLTNWTHNYKWPILFLVAVPFWNLVGAGPIRISNQSAYRAVLHAGAKYGCRPCPRGSVRSIWNAGHGAEVAKPANSHSTETVENRRSGLCLLDYEYRVAADDPPEPAAYWHCPNLGQRGKRHVVPPFA